MLLHLEIIGFCVKCKLCGDWVFCLFTEKTPQSLEYVIVLSSHLSGCVERMN